MIQSPPRRPSNVAAIVILGFFAGFVAEFVVDLVLDFAVTVHSLAEVDAIGFVISLVTGALVGGVMFLGRPRHYGVAAVAGVSAVVSGIIADELATPLFFTIRHLPISAELLTGYFTHARAMFWIGNLVCAAVAAGLTALRVQRVRAAEGTPPGTGVPGTGVPGPWGPPQTPDQPRGPWSPPPQGPYGPPPQGPPSQGPYGQPAQPPYEPPYGPPGR